MAVKPALKYVILYVESLDEALAFYGKVFGFEEKMRQGPYAETSTGATTLAFCERGFVAEHLGIEPGPKGVGASEIGIVVAKPQVSTFFQQALAAGATSLLLPKEQPWGQMVSYVRDPAGHLLEICSPND